MGSPSTGNARPYEGNGHYYAFTSKKINWSDSLDESEDQQLNGVKGYLATVTSKGENDFIVNKSNNGSKITNNAFIGGTDHNRYSREEEWIWYGSNAPENGENGLLTTGPNIGVYYPSGFSTNVDGQSVMVPASHIAVRTYAYNDSVAFPWFAPAGTRRGVIDNATSVGFINSEGEFETTAVSEGLRDSLYSVHINPISFVTGAGLLNFGQKTRQLTASALDRINVARLVAFVRLQLDKITRPFIFEPNDQLTRNEVKQSVESFLLELVAQRGLFDFAVVCDETNNTPSRIDRNELYIDVAIEPVKAVEFIYIPVRLKNTGEIAELGL